MGDQVRARGETRRCLLAPVEDAGDELGATDDHGSGKSLNSKGTETSSGMLRRYTSRTGGPSGPAFLTEGAKRICASVVLPPPLIPLPKDSYRWPLASSRSFLTNRFFGSPTVKNRRKTIVTPGCQ